MRLVTRSDFDGLACVPCLKKRASSTTGNLPIPRICRMVWFRWMRMIAWPMCPMCRGRFDHHSSEHERLELAGQYKGSRDCPLLCPDHLRLLWWGGTLPQFTEMMEAVDKVDSANLTIDEIQNPTGFPIGFLMDPRTGLGRWRISPSPTISSWKNLLMLLSDHDYRYTS